MDGKLGCFQTELAAWGELREWPRYWLREWLRGWLREQTARMDRAADVGGWTAPVMCLDELRGWASAPELRGWACIAELRG
ncbi:hypothetical protein [Nonomuraea sp. 10N515B]|uniref:hypothetical protein n=1 Tax=Nonomuraea sp. 10N515B TaxID=3457422 RepID=UPI003FCE7EFC